MIDQNTPSSNTQPPKTVEVVRDESGVVNKLLAAITAVMVILVICLAVAVAVLSTEIQNSNGNGNPEQQGSQQPNQPDLAVAGPPPGPNPCEDTDPGLKNIQCNSTQFEFFLKSGEQSGVNVTKGYNGDLNVSSVPIKNPYYMEGMCPVNVHWHLGTEHYSAGQYDEFGTGPKYDSRRVLAEKAEAPEYRCSHYDETDSKFTTDYSWKHCTNMRVGETYEIHWPHSNMGACGTPNQFQSPFYDGVFCRWASHFNSSMTLEGAKIGVQSQVFTVVNDEDYYYPNLLNGMIVDGDMGSDIARYTGSTTGSGRNNEDKCSQYTTITWQVDRKCHLISASSFDKLCADMKSQRDDMSIDLYPHGSRELVADELAANNHQLRQLRGD